MNLNEAQAYIASLGDAEIAELDNLIAPELERVTFGDQNWRIDNLYWILDEGGKAIRFVRNDAQRQWWGNRWCLNAILKARQLGFSTAIVLEMLDECLFTPNFAAGIIDYSLDDASKKLEKIKFAYRNLPARIKKQVPLLKANTETLEFANGSKIEVGISHRGGTFQHLHVSEYGKISATRPEKAKEIKTGGFGTVHPGYRIDVESTAEGVGGEFHELIQRADALQKEGRPLSELDFRLHFFAWWQHPGYRIDPEKVRVPKDLDEYFLELKGKYGIELDAAQRAWYTAKRYQIGPDKMFSEYPSFPEEAFKASVDGAYFKRQMNRARIDGRIGDVPYDEGRLVNTFWDIGNDTTSIWFHQTDGLRHRLIDYFEDSDEPISFYARELSARRSEFGWTYGKHYGPHDIGNTEWGQVAQPGAPAKNRMQIAQGLGIKFTLIPRVAEIGDAIDAGRQFLGLCWIDQKNCEQGIRCLDNYRKKWNEQLATWSREPLHDWASHGASSLMTGALGYKPEKEKKKPLPRTPILASDDRSGHGWMAS
jgi:hypothetical protein